jgi:hypothetical protein
MRGLCLTTILPEMTLAEAIDTTRIHRVAGLTGRRTAVVTTRPCRAPHQTIADVGLIGGGQVPMPGEVSLAHHGVLFLDELPEFRRHVLEVLRQPLEEGVTRIQSPARSRPYSSINVGGTGCAEARAHRLTLERMMPREESHGLGHFVATQAERRLSSRPRPHSILEMKIGLTPNAAAKRRRPIFFSVRH